MRLVTASEMGSIDRLAISEFGIPGVVLMENAGLQVVKAVTDVLGDPAGKHAVIFAGKGNNGGDGFVVARHLLNMGAQVQVFLAAEQEQISGDAQVNLNIWLKTGQKVFPLTKSNDINLVRLALMNADLVVDALYGTGFKGTIQKPMATFIEAINACGKPVVAVDIPSGLEADTGRVNGPCIRASYTVTFALPKIGLVLPESRLYVGKLHIADISIPAALLADNQAKRNLITKQLVCGDWPRREGREHKGNFGRVLLIAGSRGMSGAAVLAAQAAARSGAGLVTLGVPAGIHNIVETKLTEVMTFPLPETNNGTLDKSALDMITERAVNTDVIALGPGLGGSNETKALVRELLLKIEKPCVLDADGLNAMTGRTELFRLVKSDLVLTPHPGEMARLCGISIDKVQNNRLATTAKKAVEWNTIVVLKGAGTVIAEPDGSIYINSTGNPGMASGGTGDVLTGLIAGLMAQGMTAGSAAAAGVYLHGRAGDAAAEQQGMAGMLATDILEQLPGIIKELENEIG
ncbi:MAG: carbohydrate kinase [Peptococcaceae bacterium BRH_c8a]|nr:MAG: carbohydrate kinase [Peptococcaceae bacterium BRH_c8a]